MLHSPGQDLTHGGVLGIQPPGGRYLSSAGVQPRCGFLGHPQRVPGHRSFRDRIWYPAVEAAVIRRFPPRIMRHTAASWLVIDGVPLYDVQALLGHDSYRTTERYAHLAPDAHDKIVQSWARRHAAPLPHGHREGRPS
jgi:integrase